MWWSVAATLVVVDPCLPRPTPCCAQLAALTTAQIQARVRMLDGNIRALNTESSRLDHERKVNEARLKENVEKIKLNKQLPYLISNVIEVRRPLGLCLLRRQTVNASSSASRCTGAADVGDPACEVC